MTRQLTAMGRLTGHCVTVLLLHALSCSTSGINSSLASNSWNLYADHHHSEVQESITESYKRNDSSSSEAKNFREPARLMRTSLNTTDNEEPGVVKKSYETRRDDPSLPRNNSTTSTNVLSLASESGTTTVAQRSSDPAKSSWSPSGRLMTVIQGLRSTMNPDLGQTADNIETDCCSTNDIISTPAPPDNYNSNDNEAEGDDYDGENASEENRGRDTEENYGKNLNEFSDRSDGIQNSDDYKDNEDDSNEEPSSDTAKMEYYAYFSDNITSNESQISDTKDEQDSNSDYYYSQGGGGNQWIGPAPQLDNDQNIRGSPADYDAENRDYHLGIEHHNFDLHLSQRISEMPGGHHRGQTISLRWLEHHPINHFAIFLWLVVALALVGIVLTAYRFRHSVINAIQYTRTNYKEGRQFGIEEANDLLSHAQV